jgi:hypothetical protein
MTRARRLLEKETLDETELQQLVAARSVPDGTVVEIDRERGRSRPAAGSDITR